MYYVVKPDSTILADTGAQTEYETKRLFLTMRPDEYPIKMVLSSWNKYFREGYRIMVQGNLFD